MKFHEFLQTLYPFCGNGDSKSDFVIKVLGNITEKQEDKVFDYTPDYLGRIYSGEKQITRTSASYIITNIDLLAFDSFIFETTTEDARNLLCLEFKKEINDCDNENITSKLGELLEKILSEIAERKTQTNLVNPDSVVVYNDNEIFVNGKKLKISKKLLPPQEIEEGEVKYVFELLKAYADKENVPFFDIESLNETYKNDLQRQRSYFFDAESVRRGLRDVSTKEFEELKHEVYEGIIDVILKDYKNGYERLLSVLQQVTQISHGKSLLWKVTKLIGPTEKKGVCHMLVNDGKITWVDENE